MNPAWMILQKILRVLNFSEENIKIVCDDMDEMAQIELTTSLFTDLTDSEKEEITKEMGELKGPAAMEVLVKYFKGRISKEEMHEMAQEVAEELLGEYINNILDKVKNQTTRDKIEAVLSEAQTAS